MAASDAAVPPLGVQSMRRSDAQPQSKRDRKRQLLMDRLAALTDKFDRDRDLTYRDQLQKIQIDTTLVQRIDPYAPNALKEIEAARQEHRNIPGQNVTAENARTLMDMAGPKFQDWAQSVADLSELRDFQLTRQHHEYERKRQEYKNTYNYKVETAKREHQALSTTLRDRLINSLATKKSRLNKEKEALELSDSSALLFHPNQFSIANPASPGGTHGKRATRHRKDADELGGLSDGKKRKRNAGDDDGSPAPVRRALDSSGTTPLWQSEKLRVAAKQNGPLYSIDKLFTDKELALTYNTAAVAAHQHILRHRANGGQVHSPDSDSADEGHENGDADGTESWPSAPMMERAPSHATRSTRGGANQNFVDHKILGLEAIENFEVPSNLEKLHSQEVPRMPPAAPAQYLKPNMRATDQNSPLSLSADTINSDLQVMGYFKQFDQQYRVGAGLELNGGLKKVLEKASVPSSEGKYVALVGAPRRDPDVLRKELGLPPSVEQTSPEKHSTPANAALISSAAASLPMSRQSSQGGVAMSRQGTNGSTRGKGRKS